MKRLFPDMTPEEEELEIERYRQMSPQEKLQLTLELTAAAWEKTAAEVRAQYGPDISERELRLRLRCCARMYLKEDTLEDQSGVEEYLRRAFAEEGIEFD